MIAAAPKRKDGPDLVTQKPIHERGEIRWVGELQRVDVKPGDRFVLSIDRPVSMEMKRCLEHIWEDFVGSNAAKILILEPGMKLGVFGDASNKGGSST